LDHGARVGTASVLVRVKRSIRVIMEKLGLKKKKHKNFQSLCAIRFIEDVSWY
jgi:hypothetical protein